MTQPISREQWMTLFEKECANWQYDFTKERRGDGADALVTYQDYNTGVMFAMFEVGAEAALREFRNG